MGDTSKDYQSKSVCQRRTQAPQNPTIYKGLQPSTTSNFRQPTHLPYTPCICQIELSSSCGLACLCVCVSAPPPESKVRRSLLNLPVINPERLRTAKALVDKALQVKCGLEIGKMHLTLFRKVIQSFFLLLALPPSPPDAEGLLHPGSVPGCSGYPQGQRLGRTPTTTAKSTLQASPWR